MELHELNIGLCKAFGVDPQNVRQLTLTLTPDDLPTLTITKSVLDSDSEAVSEVVSQTRLVPVENKKTGWLRRVSSWCRPR